MTTREEEARRRGNQASRIRETNDRANLTSLLDSAPRCPTPRCPNIGRLMGDGTCWECAALEYERMRGKR